MNYNGYYDEGEPGYAHVTMEAIKISNGESMGKTETDDDGNFRLEGLRGGDYRLRIILPDDGSIFTIVPENGGENANGAAQRYSRRESAIEPLTLQSGGEASALVGVAMGAKIRGTVFQDADYNGQLDQKEKRISGVQVQAVDENGAIAATTTTNADGKYALDGLMPGTYTVEFKRVSGTGLHPSAAGTGRRQLGCGAAGRLWQNSSHGSDHGGADRPDQCRDAARIDGDGPAVPRRERQRPVGRRRDRHGRGDGAAAVRGRGNRLDTNRGRKRRFSF
ncbi:MAG: SdrD B-like domain-containing protein [Lachnospiraceae bacterium]